MTGVAQPGVWVFVIFDWFVTFFFSNCSEVTTLGHRSDISIICTRVSEETKSGVP